MALIFTATNGRGHVYSRKLTHPPFILVGCSISRVLGRKRAALYPAFRSCHRLSPRLLHRNTSARRTMRWPGSGTEDDKKRSLSESWLEPLRPSEWRASLTNPQTVITSIALTITSVGAVRMYKTYLRRIPSVNHIKPHYFRRKGLFGRVTSVGDADNFRLYHTPGGRLAGWGWLPWKRVPVKRDALSNQTVGSD